MRKQVVAAVGLLVAGAALAVAGRLAAVGVLDLLAGLLLVASACVAASLLPAWRRLRGPPMPGLFERPRRGQRWCSACGRPAPPGACPRCRGEPPRLLQKKRRSGAQEREP